MKKLYYSICLLLFLSCQLQAQIRFKTEYLGTSSYWLDMPGDEPRQRVGNAKGSAVVYQGDINLPLSIKTDVEGCPTVWGVGLGASYASLTNRNFTEDMVLSEIMNLELGFYHLRSLTGKWSLMGSLGAGIYTPSARFSDIRFKNVMGSIGAVVIYQFRPNLKLGGGVALNSSLGYPMIFPAIYFDWALEGRFNVNISLLNSMNLSAGYELSRYFTLGIAADMNGQAALLKKDGKDVVFSHQYITAGLRPEIRINRFLSFPFTAGINAFRPAYFSERTLKGLFKNDNDYYFQIAPYFSAAVNIGF